MPLLLLLDLCSATCDQALVMHRQESVVRGIYVIGVCVTSLSRDDPKGIHSQVP